MGFICRAGWETWRPISVPRAAHPFLEVGDIPNHIQDYFCIQRGSCPEEGRRRREGKQSQKFYWHEVSCLRNVPNYTNWVLHTHLNPKRARPRGHGHLHSCFPLLPLSRRRDTRLLSAAFSGRWHKSNAVFTMSLSWVCCSKDTV